MSTTIKRSLGGIENVKLKLGITDTSQDTYLDTLNQQISQAIEDFVFGEHVIGFRNDPGTSSPPPDLVEYHDGGLDAIVLRRDLSDDNEKRDLVVLLEDGITLTQGTEYQIDAHPSRTVYRLVEADNFRAVFANGIRNVKVTYTAESVLAPADIALLVETEVARAFLQGNNNSTDGGFLVIQTRSPSEGDSVTYRTPQFTEFTLSVLNRYKNDQRFF